MGLRLFDLFDFRFFLGQLEGIEMHVQYYERDYETLALGHR